MSTTSRSVVLAALATWVALSACDQDRAAPLPFGSGGSSSGGTRSNGGAGNVGGSEDGGADGEAGSDSGSGEAGQGSSGAPSASGGTGGTDKGTAGEGPGIDVDPCPSEATSGSPPDSSAICSSADFGAGSAVPVTNGSSAQLLGITPDELTVLWFSATGSAGSTLLADRASADDDFGEAQTIETYDVRSVSPDGLRLFALSDARDAFLELTRAARGESFDSPSEGAFSEINADADEQGWLLGDPVIAPDDLTLYYTVYGFPAEEYPVRVSTRSDVGVAWPVGEPLEACELKAYGSIDRRPTAVSADGLTLFYYDSLKGSQRAAWRESVDGDFVWSTALEDYLGATPNAACDRLYFTGESGLTVADAE